MTTRAQLEALLERVRNAAGPDRNLEVDIVDRLVSPAESKSHARYDLDAYCFTSSLDAVVALIKWKLPDWNAALWIDDEPQGNLYPKQQPFPADLDIYESGTTPALAMLAAFLKAKLSTLPEEAAP